MSEFIRKNKVEFLNLSTKREEMSMMMSVLLLLLVEGGRN